jgi:D-proline reductase (dithiol) PrdB
MASISDLPLKHRLFLFAYRFRSIDPPVWSPLPKPLSECRVVLVTTAAFYLPAQAPFDESVKGGDSSYRVLPARDPAALSSLGIGHRSSAFDPSGIEVDYNLALPADRFLELEAAGRIGRLHEEALSFMGSITAPGRLTREAAPEAAERLRNAGADVAFLCPV